MSSDWNQLTDNVQVALSREALYRAADLIAMQAEVLAGEIESNRCGHSTLATRPA